MPATAKSVPLENGQVPDLDGVQILLPDDVSTSLSRAATVRWMGSPPGGEPRLTVGSHSLSQAPTLNVDVVAPHPMATSPGELLAGGFAAIFAKVLADQLLQDRTQATELVVQAVFVVSRPGPGLGPVLREIRCAVEARVAGIDQARLEQVGELAMRRSIDGLAMRADAISVSLSVSLVGTEPEATEPSAPPLTDSTHPSPHSLTQRPARSTP